MKMKNTCLCHLLFHLFNLFNLFNLSYLFNLFNLFNLFYLLDLLYLFYLFYLFYLYSICNKYSGRSHSNLEKLRCTLSSNLNVLISKYVNLVLQLTNTRYTEIHTVISLTTLYISTQNL